MGLTGTDVAKQASEVVLMDDSFHTLVGAIQSGRTIYANITKGAISTFVANASELFAVLASFIGTMLLGIPLSISVLLILGIDLVAEFFPIAALGSDPAEGEIMRKEPRDPRHHIINLRTIIDVAWSGLIIGGLAYTNYLLFFSRAGVNPTQLDLHDPLYYSAMTMTYVTIVVCGLVSIMQRRSVKGFFTRYQFSNKYFWMALAFSAFCILNIVYNPLISQYFKSGPLSPVDWFFAFVAAAIFLTARETQRIIQQRSTK
jgi:Ca2+-transporting ATPase